MSIPQNYADDVEFLEKMDKYFGNTSLADDVVDFKSLAINLRKYLKDSDIPDSVVYAVGEKMLDKINHNRRLRGLDTIDSIAEFGDGGVVYKKKIKVKSYIKEGKEVKSYEKHRPKRFSDREVNFLKTRLDMDTKQIMKRFNAVFKDRTDSSLTSKISRLRSA